MHSALKDWTAEPSVNDSVVAYLIHHLVRELDGENPLRIGLRTHLLALENAREQVGHEKRFPAWPTGRAAYLASELYRRGDGVPERPTRARAWMVLALAQREPRALCRRALAARDEDDQPFPSLLAEAIWANVPGNTDALGPFAANLRVLFPAMAEVDPDGARVYLEHLQSRVGTNSPLVAQIVMAINQTETGATRPRGPSVRVVQSFTPSDRREAREELKRYAPLHERPTPLDEVPPPFAVRETLNAEFPWFREVTDWVAGELAVRKLGNPVFHLPPVLLLGPPGIGKTAYVSRLAELSELPVRTVALGGQSDNRDLKGTARGWSSGEPGMPLRLIMETNRANPILVLDELDKAGGSDRNGNVHDFLLQVTEPETARVFYDDFLQGHADLSWISWVGTANYLAPIPEALVNRVTVFNVAGPRPEHYPAIVERTRQRFAREYRLPEGALPTFTDRDWQILRRAFRDPRTAIYAVRERLKQRLVQDLGKGDRGDQLDTDDPEDPLPQ